MLIPHVNYLIQRISFVVCKARLRKATRMLSSANELAYVMKRTLLEKTKAMVLTEKRRVLGRGCKACRT